MSVEDRPFYAPRAQNYGLTKPDAYTPYAAGYKLYGGGRSSPTSGPTDRAGYLERNRTNDMKRNALLRLMQENQKGNYMSSASLYGQG